MSVVNFVKSHFQNGWTLLAYANPNRHGYLVLIAKGGEYIVAFEDEGFDPQEFSTDDFVEAKNEYERQLNHLLDTPNWEAQDEYDEMWGH